MITIKLTSAQRSAVEIYVTDPVHADDYPEARLVGSFLTIDARRERAVNILVDASNSADVGDARTRDAGAVRALEHVIKKLPKP